MQNSLSINFKYILGLLQIATQLHCKTSVEHTLILYW